MTSSGRQYCLYCPFATYGQHETLENRESLYLSFVLLSSWLSLVDPCRLFSVGKLYMILHQGFW